MRDTVHGLKVDGIRIHTLEKGSGDPLLLVHGWAASHRIWSKVLDPLSAARRVIAFDWPGCGDSDNPDAPYSLAWYAEHLGAVLNGLGLDSVDIVAHSMGAGIAVMLALEHPERVKSLTLVSPFLQGTSAFYFGTRMKTLPGIRRLMYALSKWRWARRLIASDWTYRTPLDFDLIDDISRGTYRSLMRPILSMKETDLSDRLAELKMPVRVLGGDKDRVLRLTQLDLAKKHWPVEVLPDCGHCPMQESPEEFVRFVAAPRPQ